MAPHTSGLAFLWSIEEENRGSTSQVGSNMGDCEENSAGDTPRLCQAHWIHQQSTWTHLPSSFPTWCGTWGHRDAAVGTQPWQCWGLKGWKGLSPPKSFCVIQVSHSVSSPPSLLQTREIWDSPNPGLSLPVAGLEVWDSRTTLWS